MKNYIIIIIYLILIYFLLYNYNKKKNYSFNTKIDIITIIYNNKREINLLKLQAHSFKYVDNNLINNIYIIYNDINNNKFSKIFKKDIIKFYPNNLKKKIKLIFLKDLNLYFKKTNWYNQQIIKLKISNLIKSNYYLTLDTKNHFIRNVNYYDFFYKNKPILFTGYPGDMIKYYFNGLKYFNIKDPYNFRKKEKKKLVTTTPYLFKTKYVLDLINYIEKKEKINFEIFFIKNRKKLTEFYLYSTYLIYSKKIKTFSFKQRINITIFKDPNKKWNSYDQKKVVINNEKYKIFGLHSLAITKMDKQYKKNLISLYKNFYDDNIIKFIEKNILYKRYRVLRI